MKLITRTRVNVIHIKHERHGIAWGQERDIDLRGGHGGAFCGKMFCVPFRCLGNKELSVKTNETKRLTFLVRKDYQPHPRSDQMEGLIGRLEILKGCKLSTQYLDYQLDIVSFELMSKNFVLWHAPTCPLQFMVQATCMQCFCLPEQH